MKVRRKEVLELEFNIGKELRKVCSAGSAEVFRVTGFVGAWVHLDRNHPFAGKELHFEVEIMDVRPDPRIQIVLAERQKINA